MDLEKYNGIEIPARNKMIWEEAMLFYQLGQDAQKRMEEDKKYIYISGHMQYGDSIVSGNKNRTVTTKSLLWNRTRRRRYLGTGIGKPECRLYLPDSRRPQGYTMGHDAPVPLDRL